MAEIGVDVGEGMFLQSSLAPGPPLVPCGVEEEMAVMEVDLGEGMSLWSPVAFGPPFLL